MMSILMVSKYELGKSTKTIGEKIQYGG